MTKPASKPIVPLSEDDIETLHRELSALTDSLWEILSRRRVTMRQRTSRRSAHVPGPTPLELRNWANEYF